MKVGRVLPDGVQLSLDSWNAQRLEFWQDSKQRLLNPSLFPNGLTCPECRGSLYDTMQTVSISPVMLRVRCQRCNFKGERYD
jgi:uncharacterized protein with PIN domain